MKKIAVLSGNFSGNVGDLFIFETVLSFINSEYGSQLFDVYPYPARNNHVVSLPYVCSEKFSISIKEPLYRIRGSVEHYMRAHKPFKSLASNYYFDVSLFKNVVSSSLINDYDLVLVLGGEMDIPFTMLDVHAYIRKFGDGVPVVYGPISLSVLPEMCQFLEKRFAEVKEIGIRDPHTFSVLENEGFSNIQLVPDCAFLSYSSEKFRKRNWQGKIALGLHASWGYREDLVAIINKFGEVAASLDSELCLFCTHPNEDSILMRRISDARNKGEFSFGKPNVFIPTSTNELCDFFSEMDLVISDRLHGIIISMLQGCNVLPLKTREKIIGYCQYLSIENSMTGNESIEDVSALIAGIKDDYLSLRSKQEEFCKKSYAATSSFYKKTCDKVFL